MPARKDPTFCGAFLFYYVDMESYTANSKISTTIFLSIPKKPKPLSFQKSVLGFINWSVLVVRDRLGGGSAQLFAHKRSITKQCQIDA